MAQTKRKRQTKHRGNAAGMIEARGRTGRPGSTPRSGQDDRASRRQERLNRQPTWKGSALRAGVAGIFIFFFILLFNKPKHGSPLASAVLFAVVASGFYVFAGYYFEMYLWRRRQNRQGRSGTR
ncbi:MAG: hypothetical protein ACP5H2_07990 [Solirubrobacteraceae bacterium]